MSQNQLQAGQASNNGGIFHARLHWDTTKHENNPVYVTLNEVKGLVLPQGEILRYAQNDSQKSIAVFVVNDN